MTIALYLVRHARLDVERHSDPAAWPLSADGLAAARRLASRLPAGALLVASDEPKAWQTLDPDGDREVRRDSRVGEVRRAERFTIGFRRVRRFSAGGAVLAGWEPQAQVGARFSAAVIGLRFMAPRA